MSQVHHRKCRVEKHRMWTSWSATIPLLLAYVLSAMCVFADNSSLLWMSVIALLIVAGVGLIHLGSDNYAILPFLYKFRDNPNSVYTIVKYKTYWGTSKTQNMVWRKVERILPGIYRLVGEEVTIESNELIRRPDTFHSFGEYDEERDEK